jgi:predicted phosphodiesterase
MVLLNPGSPILPHHLSTRLGTIAIVEISAERVEAEVVVLGHTHGRPNPTRALRLSVTAEDFRLQIAGGS